MSWHENGAKETAAQIRRAVRADIKNGTLPTGSKVTARTDRASMMTAVKVNLDTAEPGRYFRATGDIGLTEEGAALADQLAEYVKPYLHKVDGKMSFLFLSLDGLTINPYRTA